MSTARTVVALPFLWCAIAALHVGEAFAHVAALINGEPFDAEV